MIQHQPEAAASICQDELVAKAGIGALEVHNWISARAAFTAAGGRSVETHYDLVPDYAVGYALAMGQQAYHLAPRAGRGGPRLSAAVGRAFPVHPLLSHMMPTFRKAHRHHKTALLRVVEALVERLFRLGQTPQRIGACRQSVGVAA